MAACLECQRKHGRGTQWRPVAVELLTAHPSTEYSITSHPIAGDFVRALLSDGACYAKVLPPVHPPSRPLSV